MKPYCDNFFSYDHPALTTWIDCSYCYVYGHPAKVILSLKKPTKIFDIRYTNPTQNPDRMMFGGI